MSALHPAQPMNVSMAGDLMKPRGQQPNPRPFASPCRTPQSRRPKFERGRSMPVLSQESRWKSTEEQRVLAAPPTFRGMTSPSSGRPRRREQKSKRGRKQREVRKEDSFDSIQLPFDREEIQLFGDDSYVGTMPLGGGAAGPSTPQVKGKKSLEVVHSPAERGTMRRGWSPSRQPEKSSMRGAKASGVNWSSIDQFETVNNHFTSVKDASISSISIPAGLSDEQDSFSRLNSSSESVHKDPPLPPIRNGFGNRWEAALSPVASLPPAFQALSPPLRAREIMSLNTDDSDIESDSCDGGDEGSQSLLSANEETEAQFVVDDRLPPAFQAMARFEYKRKTNTGGHSPQPPRRPISVSEKSSDTVTSPSRSASEGPVSRLSARDLYLQNAGTNQEVPPAFKTAMSPASRRKWLAKQKDSGREPDSVASTDQDPRILVGTRRDPVF